MLIKPSASPPFCLEKMVDSRIKNKLGRGNHYDLRVNDKIDKLNDYHFK